MTKKTIQLILGLSAMLSHAQVLMGEGATASPSNASVINNSSVSLAFSNNNKGVILPWVTKTEDVLGQTNGSLVYDVSRKSVHIKLASGWLDLTQNDNGVVDTSLQDPATSQANGKVSIGTPTTTKGILVLEDTTKAMVLPKVTDPHLNINYPATGMMVYDNTKQTFCVFNGTEWTFWKP